MSLITAAPKRTPVHPRLGTNLRYAHVVMCLGAQGRQPNMGVKISRMW